MTFDFQRSTQVKIFFCLKEQIIISYPIFIDTFYLNVFLRRSTSKSSIDTSSRTVLGIFDFKIIKA